MSPQVLDSRLFLNVGKCKTIDTASYTEDFVLIFQGQKRAFCPHQATIGSHFVKVSDGSGATSRQLNIFFSPGATIPIGGCTREIQ